MLDNDWDPEDDALSASVVDDPAHGTLSSFGSSNGTFTYTPDSLFVGIDMFTYEVSDGTTASALATVSIAVGGQFGPQTNSEEISHGAGLMTGYVELGAVLTPEINLLYNSGTVPNPIVALETFLQDTSSIPDSITAQLTFDGTAGTAYSYDTSSLSAGDSLRFALQYDATGLATGHYDTEIDLSADMSGTPVVTSYVASHSIVNRGSSSSAFGRGWQLEGLDSLVVQSDGALLVQDDGNTFWFPSDGSGGFLSAAGDVRFSSLIENMDGTYTLTSKVGLEKNFSSAGLLTSRVDRNGNTVSYSYTSGLLTRTWLINMAARICSRHIRGALTISAA